VTSQFTLFLRSNTLQGPFKLLEIKFRYLDDVLDRSRHARYYYLGRYLPSTCLPRYSLKVLRWSLNEEGFPIPAAAVTRADKRNHKQSAEGQAPEYVHYEAYRLSAERKIYMFHFWYI